MDCLQSGLPRLQAEQSVPRREEDPAGKGSGFAHLASAPDAPAAVVGSHQGPCPHTVFVVVWRGSHPQRVCSTGNLHRSGSGPGRAERGCLAAKRQILVGVWPLWFRPRWSLALTDLFRPLWFRGQRWKGWILSLLPLFRSLLWLGSLDAMLHVSGQQL